MIYFKIKKFSIIFFIHQIMKVIIKYLFRMQWICNLSVTSDQLFVLSLNSFFTDYGVKKYYFLSKKKIKINLRDRTRITNDGYVYVRGS